MLDTGAGTRRARRPTGRVVQPALHARHRLRRAVRRRIPTIFAATRAQVAKGRERGLKWAGVEAPEIERLTAKLREARAGQPPATVAELRDGLGTLSPAAEKNFSIVASSWAAQGILVRAA